MISPWLIYFIGIADKVGGFFMTLTIASAISIWVSGMSGNYNLAKKFSFYAVIFAFLASVTPSSKTVAAMIVIPPIVNNKQVQELPNNVLEFINDYLKDAKKSLKEKDV